MSSTTTTLSRLKDFTYLFTLKTSPSVFGRKANFSVVRVSVHFIGHYDIILYQLEKQYPGYCFLLSIKSGCCNNKYFVTVSTDSFSPESDLVFSRNSVRGLSSRCCFGSQQTLDWCQTKVKLSCEEIKYLLNPGVHYSSLYFFISVSSFVILHVLLVLLFPSYTACDQFSSISYHQLVIQIYLLQGKMILNKKIKHEFLTKYLLKLVLKVSCCFRMNFQSTFSVLYSVFDNLVPFDCDEFYYILER